MEQMRRFEDFEAIMILLAAEEGWQFRDGDDEIAPEAVFNEETYAPAMLGVAEFAMGVRELDIDLGVRFEARDDAMMGVAVAFDEKAPLVCALWRVVLAAYVVDNLPQIGLAKDLASLREVFTPTDSPILAAG